MSDRTTKVTLTAQVSGYIAGMEKAAAATRKTGSEAEKLAQKKEGFTQVGHALLAIGAVAAVGVGLAIKSFADFDAKMSQVKTLSHATAGEMSQLSEAALTMGQSIGFSANEVADAEIEMVKAGIAVKDIMGGALKGALDLAAAGQINVAEATSIASSAMVQFGLSGKDVPHIADLLAAGADKALGGVTDLGLALKYAGPVAASFGISLDETVGTLSLFAQNGILADQAGTGLRGVLSSLTSPSAVAADTMKKYNITLFDGAGKFIGLAGAAGQLHDRLGGLTDKERSFALGQIFGNQQITTATILMKGGAQAVKQWTNSVNDSGFAAEQARGKMDNLNGDIKKLGAAFESDLIRAGGTANGVLRGIVQTVTGLVSAFGKLPGPAQGAILAVGALVAGIGLLAGGALSVVPKLAAMRIAITELGTSMRTITVAGGAVGLAIAAVVEILAQFGAAQARAETETQNLADTLDQQTGAITKNTRAYVADMLQKDGTLAAGRAVGLSAKTVTDAYLQQPAALKKVREAIAALDHPTKEWLKNNIDQKAGAENIIGSQQKLIDAVGRGADAMKNGKERAKELADADTKAGDATAEAAPRVDELTGAIDDAAKATDEFNKMLQGLGQVNLDASTAAIKYQQSLADAANTTKEVGQSLDVTTEAGRKNMSALNDIASSAVSLIAAQQSAGASTDTLTANMGAARTSFINAAIAAGATTEQANKLADQYGLIPSNVTTAFVVSGAGEAEATAKRLKAAYDAITRNLTIHLTEIFTPDPAAGARGSGMRANANGGLYVGGVAHAFASGGMAPGIYSGGPPLYKFAEPETKWEAFISGRPGQEARNRQIWVDAGQRLGMGAGSQAAPQINVTVQSKGGVDLLKYVDVQVEQSGQAQRHEVLRGVQKR